MRGITFSIESLEERANKLLVKPFGRWFIWQTFFYYRDNSTLCYPQSKSENNSGYILIMHCLHERGDNFLTSLDVFSLFSYVLFKDDPKLTLFSVMISLSLFILFLVCLTCKYTALDTETAKCEKEWKKILHFCDHKDIKENRAETVESKIEILLTTYSSAGLKFASKKRYRWICMVGKNNVSEVTARFFKLTATLKISVNKNNNVLQIHAIFLEII